VPRLLVACSRRPGATPPAHRLPAPRQEPLSAQQRAAESERFTQAWLRLQGEVNALIDSTTAENSDQPVGWFNQGP
jgi:hypothetical protein